MSATFDQKTENANTNSDETNNHSVNNATDSSYKKMDHSKMMSGFDMNPAYYQPQNMYGAMSTGGPTGADFSVPNPSYMYSFQYNGNQGLGEGGGGLWGNSAGNPTPADNMYAMNYAGTNDYFYQAYNYPYWAGVDPAYADMVGGQTWGLTGPQQVSVSPASSAATGAVLASGKTGGAYYQTTQGMPHLRHQQHNYQTQSGDGGANGDDAVRSLESNFNKFGLSDQDDASLHANHQLNNQGSPHQQDGGSGGNQSHQKTWANVASQPARGSAATVGNAILQHKKPGGISSASGTSGAGGGPALSSSGGMGGPKAPPGRGTPGLVQHKPGSAMWGPQDHPGNRGMMQPYATMPSYPPAMGRGGAPANSMVWNSNSWTPAPGVGVGSSAAPSGGIPTFNTGDADLDKKMNEQAKKINPKTFDLGFELAKFFVIKSYSEDDIFRSIKYGIWCSTEKGNERLDKAYKEMQAKGGTVYLFFSVNGSGHFCGVATMVSSVDSEREAGVWCQSKWRGQFLVEWVYVKDVPNTHLRHIRLESNDNKPVTNTRDATEVEPLDKGKQVIKVIHNYKHTTSIFDDFNHYERREQESTQVNLKPQRGGSTR